MRKRWWAAPIVAGGAALLAACGSSGSPSTSTSTPATGGTSASAPASPQSNASGTTVMTHSTSKGTVLTNAQGKTLYWFAIDTSTKSNCTGSCLTYWPPVPGPATAAAGTTLMHGFGTITGANGKTQATYDGHPLYTYIGDSGAGQINGNGKSLSGGLWWAMTSSGAKLSGSAAPSSGSSSSGSGGGGYGY